MQPHEVAKHKLINILQSAALLVVLAAIMTYLAKIIAGGYFAGVVLAGIVLVYFINPSIAPGILLRLYGARPLEYNDAPDLYDLVAAIANKAELQYIPQLCYIPSAGINAFTTGVKRNTFVALSHGLLQRLSLQEIAGVLAHEISHIKNNDINVMTFASMTNRATKLLSVMGQFLLLLNLPLIIFSEVTISWLAIILLILAPVLTDIVQLALSRVREFNADLGSATLLGSPKPLMSALFKMDPDRTRFFSGFFPRQADDKIPSLLRTHPTTRERLERLEQLSQREPAYSTLEIPVDTFTQIPVHQVSQRKPLRYRRFYF